MASGQLTRWSCHRMECLADFMRCYFAGAKNNSCLIDLFAGPGIYSCKESLCQPECLELKLVKENPLSRLILVVKSSKEAGELKSVLQTSDKKHPFEIVIGNPMHEAIIRRVFDFIPRSTQSVAIINPPGYSSLRWSVIKKLAQHGTDWQGHKMDLCIVFPVEMALLRNLLRPACQSSINRLYGCEDWQRVRQEFMEHKINLDKTRDELVELFKVQLKKLNYKHVDDIEPARFSSPPYYHIIWASDRSSRLKELRETWGKERFLPCEMFHQGKSSRA